MPYRTILVHTDESGCASERIKLAAAIAMAANAHLVGIAVSGASPYLIRERALESDPNLRLHLEALQQRARRGLSEFETCVQKLALPSWETRLVNDEAGAGMCLQARYTDLVVIGQYDRDETSPVVMHDFPQYVVLHCGRPVLLVPHAGGFENIGRRVLIGWDASLAAIRAVTGALPLLERAQHVCAVSFGEERDRNAPPSSELTRYLSRHGVKAEQVQEGETKDAGAALLDYCKRGQYDLLVMGAYGHTRFREILLGGVTRTALTETCVPLLLAH